MTDRSESRHLCMNCGTELQGRFCSACGQRDQPRRLPLRHLLHDVLGSLWNFDTMILGTLGLLLRRPGHLTADYLAGRRVRHVPPFKLYVIVSFFLFLAFSAIPIGPRKPGGPPPIQIKVETEAAPNKASSWESRLKTRIAHAQQDPERLRISFLSNLSKSLFLLMPLLAAILHLLHLRKRDNFFVDHLVLSLHFHTFAFLAMLLLLGLAFLPGEDWGLLPGLAIIFSPPVYLACSLQHLHGRGWIRSFIKAGIAAGLYGLLLSASLVGLLIWSLPQ